MRNITRRTDSSSFIVGSIKEKISTLSFLVLLSFLLSSYSAVQGQTTLGEIVMQPEIGPDASDTQTLPNIKTSCYDMVEVYVEIERTAGTIEGDDGAIITIDNDNGASVLIFNIPGGDIESSPGGVWSNTYLIGAAVSEIDVSVEVHVAGGTLERIRLNSVLVTGNSNVTILPIDGTELCNGSDFVFQATALAGTNYDWSYTGSGAGTFAPNNSTASQTTTFSATAAGTPGSISVIATDGNGCMSSDNVSVDINDAITTGIEQPSQGICVDGSLMLSPTAGTPTGGNGNYIYLWEAYSPGLLSVDYFSDETVANPTFAIPPADQALFVDGQTIDIFLTVSDNAGCSTVSTSITLTVSVPPAMDIDGSAPTPVCSGDMNNIVITVVDNLATADGYFWSASYGAVTGGAYAASDIYGLFANPINETLTNATSATVTVTYTITPYRNIGGGDASAGDPACIGPSFMLTIDVEPDPKATPSATSEVICHNTVPTITVDVTALNGNDYLISNITVPAGVGGLVSAIGLTPADGDPIETGMLTNSNSASSDVVYEITPYTYGTDGMNDGGGNDDCPGTPFNVTVTVEPDPMAAPSAVAETICHGATPTITVDVTAIDGNNYLIDNVVTTMNDAGVTGFSAIDYTRADGATIDPAALSNTGNMTEVVTYTIVPYTYGPNGMDDSGLGDDCPGTASFTVDVSVLPIPTAAPSAMSETICHNSVPTITVDATLPDPHDYLISGITNTGGVTGLASSVGDTPADMALIETGNLLNASATAQDVVYEITPYNNGPDGVDDNGLNDDCLGTPFNVTITVEPNPMAVAVDVDMNGNVNTETICDSEIPATTIDVTALDGNNYVVSNVVAVNVTGASVAPYTNADNDAIEINTLASTDGINSGTVTYTIQPYTYGANGLDNNATPDDCLGTSFDVVVTVEPNPMMLIEFTVNNGAFAPVLDGDNIELCSTDNTNTDDIIDVRVSSATVPSSGTLKYKKEITVNGVTITPDPTTTMTDQALAAATSFLYDDGTWDNPQATDAIITIKLTPYIEKGGNSTMDLGVDCIGEIITFTITVHPEPDPIAGLSLGTPIEINVCSGEIFDWDPKTNIANIPNNTEWRRNLILNNANLTGVPGDLPVLVSGANTDNLTGTITNNTSVAQTVRYRFENVRSIDNNCEGDDFWVNLIVSPPILGTTDVNGDLVLCAGEERIVSGIGTQGISPFTYAWTIVDTDGTGTTVSPASGSSTTITAGTMAAGNFDLQLVVTDAGGCDSPIYTTTFTVDPVPDANPAALALCENPEGSATGQFTLTDADATVLGGQMGVTLTYHANASDAENDLAPLASPYNSISTIIYARVEDNTTGCYSVAPVTLTVNPLPTLLMMGMDVSCNGGMDGVASVTITNAPAIQSIIEFTGALAPANWTENLPGTNDQTNVFDATTLTITGGDDGINCGTGAYSNQTIAAPFTGNLSLDYSFTNVDVDPSFDFVEVRINGVAVLSVTASGTGTFMMAVNAGDMISLGVNSIDQCLGASVASFTNISLVETTPGYTIAWSTGGSTSLINGLSPGMYTVTVTDPNMCQNTGSVTIGEPTEVIATATNTDEVCDGNNDGTITVNASGGTAPYMYSLDGGIVYQRENTFDNLAPGTYTVTVKDAEGCIITVVPDVTINSGTIITAAITNDDADNFVDCPGDQVILTATGGTNFLWDDGSTNAVRIVFPAVTPETIYSVTVSDADGCEGIASDTIGVGVDLIDPVIADCPPAGTISGTLTVSTSPGSCLFFPAWTAPTATDNCNLVSFTNNQAPVYTPGSYTITYNAADAAGNTAVCSFTLEVQDIEDPVIVGGCPADATIDTNTDVCQQDYTWLHPGFQDGCGVSFAQVAYSNGTPVPAFLPIPNPEVLGNSGGGQITKTFALGQTVVTYTIRDAALNETTCSFTVTVTENDPPSFVDPVDVSVTTEDDGADCPAAAGFTINPGDIIVSGATFQFAGTNQTAPTLVSPYPAVVAGTYADACDAAPELTVMSITADPGNGNCNNSWDVMWKVTDDYGNLTTQVQRFTVIDNTNPTASNPVTVNVECFSDIPAPDITVVTDAADNCDPAPVVAWAGDNVLNVTCDGDIVSVSRSYTVTDFCGNTITVIQTINVDDVTPPTASNPTTVNVECFSDIPMPDVSVVPDAMDNCTDAPIVTFVSDDVTSATCDGDVVTVTRTYMVADCSGNSITVTQTINVDDVTNPTASNPATVNVQCFSLIPAPDPAVVTDEADNCDGNITVVHEGDDVLSASCDGDVVTVLRTYSVTDCSGNSITVVQTINVDDTTNPTASNPADINVECFSDIPSPDITVVTDEADNCNGVPTVAFVGDDITSATCDGDVVTVTRTYSVTDCSGNSITVTQNINVDDITPPTGTTPADEMYQCIADVPVADINSIVDEADNCLGTVTVTVVDTNNGGAGCPTSPYIVTRTFTLVDCSGNTTDLVQTITVIDDTDPTWNGPLPMDQTFPVSATDCEFDVFITEPDVLDNCLGPVTISITATDNLGGNIFLFDLGTIWAGTFPAGINTVMITATDFCGNAITHTYTITIVDPILPTIICPPNLTSSCDVANPDPYTNAFAFQLAGGILDDNCSVDPSTFVLLGEVTDGQICPETITRTYYIEDVSGNPGTCDQLLQVFDVDAPVISSMPADLTISCEDSQAPADTGDASQVIATDNCTAVLDPATFSDTDDQGTDPNNCNFYTYTVTRTWSVMDDCGNTTSADQTITVQDVTAPAMPATCTDITVNLDATGNYTLVGADLLAITAGISDNCAGIGNLTFGADITMFDCTDTATPTAVTVTATDPCGNSSSCTANVFVIELVAPVAACNALTVELDATGNYALTAADSSAIVLGTTDNCIDFTTVFAPNSFTCSDLAISPVMVTVTYTDNSNNASACVALVTVEDNIAPVITCDNDTRNTNPGVCTYTVSGAEFDPPFSDNCNDATISNDLNGTATLAGEVLPKGQTTVVWIVEDGHGQTETCSAIITVVDNESPVIFDCPLNFTSATDQFVCTKDVSFTMPTFTDNCTDLTGLTVTTVAHNSEQNIDINISPMNPLAGEVVTGTYPVGITQVTITVTDGDGNSSVCQFDITVIDNEPPFFTVNCPAGILTTATGIVDGVCGTYVSWPDPVGDDWCPGVVMTSDYVPGDYFPLGTTTVTYTLTDLAGNVTSCNFDVIVNGDCGVMTELTTVFSIDGTTFMSGQTRDGVFLVQNIGTNATASPISFVITVPGTSVMTNVLDPAATTANVFGGVAVNNPDWNITPLAVGYLLESKPGVVINPGAFSVIGISFTAVGVPNSTANTKGVLVTDTAGDVDPNNNSTQATFVIN